MTMPQLPPHQVRLLAATERAEARQAEEDRYNREALREAQAMSRRAEDHATEALTGYSMGEWERAKQRDAMAREEAGRDETRPYGTPEHPAVLIDGADIVAPTPHGREARRAAAFQSDRDPVEDEVTRARALSAALTRDPVLRRARSASRRGEIRRLEVLAEAEREVSRSAGGRVRMAPTHDRRWPQVCTGPVSNYEPDDPRWRDCTENWQVEGLCRCGCGAPDYSGAVSRQAALWDGHDHPVGGDW